MVERYIEVTDEYVKQLEQEIDNLKKINEEHKKINGELREENQKYKEVIDKAVEYIKEKQKIQYKFALSHIECDDLLEIMITSTNAQCPMQIDEVTILSSVSLEGTNVVYNYSLDEDVVTMDVIEQNKISIKSNLKRALSTQDPIMKQMISACKEANTGISYRYVGDTSGNVCVIKFSSSEL